MTAGTAARAAVVAAAVAVAGCGDAGGPGGGPVELTAVDLPGLERAVAEQRGKVVLLDFWATWCGPCVQTFPHTVRTARKYADRGLVCVTASVDKPDAADAARRFLRKQGAAGLVNLHWAERPPEAVRAAGRRFGYAGSIPHLALVGRTGDVAWAGAATGVSETRLDELIEAELAKPADGK